MLVSRRFKVGLACVAVVGIAAAGSFGPLVRGEASRVAERYGATIEIERVLPTWKGVRLRGVDITLADVPSARIHLVEMDVELGEARRVALRGGMVSAVGPRELVLTQADAWRRKYSAPSSGSAASGSHQSAAPELSDLSLSWRNSAESPTESLSASGLQLSRQGSTLSIGADEAVAKMGTTKVAIKAGRIALTQAQSGYRIEVLSAGGLDADLTFPAEPTVAPAEPPASKETERPGTGLARSGGPAAKVPPVAEDPPNARGRALRDLLVGAAHQIDALLVKDAKVDVAGVRARIRRGDDTLNLGPGALAIRRDEERLLLELAPGGGSAKESEHALTFRLAVPLKSSEGASGEIVADVAGGPIWLSTLGVRDADFGLLDVARTSLETRSHVVLSADGRRLTVDGSGKVHNLSLRSAALSDEPVLGLELAWKGKGDLDLDGSRIKVEQGEVDLGSIRVVARGLYEKVGQAHRIKGDFEVPLSACQSMLDSIPRGLVPKLEGMRLAGSFALKGQARVNTARIDREFDLRWDVANSCRVVEAPSAVHVSQFRKPFRRWAYDSVGKPMAVDAGPETAGWVARGAISRFMEVAVLVTEDGSFHHHNGFDEEAIRNSIRENLRRGKFVRGASTISMQLAKNLYLDRGKNLSRKLQEAVLTMYLEQELTKEQILELYLNVVEFGPMVYGIGPAAQHYFNTSASQLSLGQALYISSIMPNPKKQHFAAGGAVTPGWSSYLRQLMQIAHKRRRISDEELEEGLRETVIRGAPAPHRAPRDESAPALKDSEDGPDKPEEGPDWIAP